MAVEKSRYKKGMFLIGPDHPGLGIVTLIVTSRSGHARERAACRHRARDAFIRSQIFGLRARWRPGTTPLRIVRLDEPDPGLPKWAAQRSG